MHLRWNGRDYSTHFKSLVGRCSINTVDRPAVWVCHFLKSEFCVVNTDVWSSALRVSKSHTAGFWEKGLTIVGEDCTALCLFMLWYLCTPPSMYAPGCRGICLSCSLLKPQCLELYLAHNRYLVNMNSLKERVSSMGSAVRSFKCDLGQVS